MPSRPIRPVSQRLVISAILTFAGIVTLAAGYFRDDATLLYAGLCVTLAGVLSGIVFLLPGKE